MKFSSVTIQMKASEQYFPVVLFIMLYKVVLTFESVDEILKCDHSNERYKQRPGFCRGRSSRCCGLVFVRILSWLGGKMPGDISCIKLLYNPRVNKH